MLIVCSFILFTCILLSEQSPSFKQMRNKNQGGNQRPNKTRPRGLMQTCERIHLLFDLV